MLGSFPYVLRQHVSNLIGRCIWHVSYVIGCVVKTINEERDGDELVFCLYIGVAERPL